MLGGRLLAAGRDRVDVEKELAARDAGLTDCAASRLEAAVTAEMTISASAHRVGGRVREPHADPLAGLAQLPAAGVGKQDVPRRDGLDPGLAQARGERLAGLAEADEAEPGRVAKRHVSSFQLPLDPLIEAFHVHDDADDGFRRRRAPARHAPRRGTRSFVRRSSSLRRSARNRIPTGVAA